MESSYDKWAPEYEPNEFEDDDKMFHIKKAVDSLNGVQKKIWLTYVEKQTYAGTAREFGVCVPTVKKYIKHIRQIIYDRL